MKYTKIISKNHLILKNVSNNDKLHSKYIIFMLFFCIAVFAIICSKTAISQTSIESTNEAPIKPQDETKKPISQTLALPSNELATNELASNAGKWDGSLEFKSNGDFDFENIEVMLIALKGSQKYSSWKVPSDKEGRFSFRNLPTSKDIAYVSSVVYHGVIYMSQLKSFADDIKIDQNIIKENIPVYESGPSTQDLSIENIHIILQGDGAGGAWVTEAIELVNNSNVSKIGSESGTQTLSLNIPKGAKDFDISQGLYPTQTSLSEDHLVYTGPIYPGEVEVVFSYRIESPTWIFKRHLSIPVSNLEVLVPTDGGASVLSPQLKKSESVSLEGVSYNKYTAEKIKGTKEFTFQIGGSDISSEHNSKSFPFKIASILMILLSFTMVISPWVWKKNNLGKENLNSGDIDTSNELLIEEKNRLLLAVKELDFDYQCKKISEDDYINLRVQYKEEAMKIMAMLYPALNESDTTLNATTSIVVDSGIECANCKKIIGNSDTFCKFCGSKQYI